MSLTRRMMWATFITITVAPRLGVMARTPITRGALVLAAFGVVAAACTGSGGTTSSSQTSTTAAPAPSATTTSAVGGDEMATTSTVAAPVEALPLAVTPAQGEGPYYPIDNLDDQDNDLTVVAGLDGTPSGNVLLLSGRLLRADGTPVAGGVIDIWQTDANGIYLHPGDPKTDDRDPFFQFSGEAVTDAEGAWDFRTIDPGYYEPRPRHVHFKVWVEGQVVLTGQIYFADDPQAAGLDELFVAGIESGSDDSGAAVLVAEYRIVLPEL